MPTSARIAVSNLYRADNIRPYDKLLSQARHTEPSLLCRAGFPCGSFRLQCVDALADPPAHQAAQDAEKDTGEHVRGVVDVQVQP